jgi:hypothetical protein
VANIVAGFSGVKNHEMVFDVSLRSLERGKVYNNVFINYLV